MAENKLEGFEDFDTGSTPGQPAGGAALDDLAGKGDTGGGDSELDSFFEDLSTIDDLEVAQEAPKAAPAAAPKAAAAPPPPKEAPAARAPRKPRAPARPGLLRKLFFYLVLLAVFGGGGYYVYVTYIAGEAKIPWPVFKMPQLPSLPSLPSRERPPPPPVAARPGKRPAMAPARPTGPGFSIQIATCFFDSCAESYKAFLEEQHLKVRVTERASQSETLEVYSQTGFSARDVAQDAAERVNLDNRMEGHAFVIEEGKVFRVSMGAFQDLARANAVKDTLNQRYGGHLVFAQRVKAVPYTLKVVVAGRYPTRADAEREVERLRALNRSLTGAFVIANEK